MPHLFADRAFAKLVRLSKISIADEMRIDHMIREISQEQLNSDLCTSAEISERTDERTTLMVAMADKIIEANRTQSESLTQTGPSASQSDLEGKETVDEPV